jgi:hypothetical protein
MIQAFFPYNYYSSATGKANSSFQVGIHYVYEQDNLTQIYGQVIRIHSLGFKVIRISLECNPLLDNDTTNLKTDEFFSATDNYGLAVALVIQSDQTPDKVNYYLDRWGYHLKHIQIMNEPETSADIGGGGALFSDDEVISKFDILYSIVQSHNLPAELYTNFAIDYLIRSNVPIDLSKKLNFVGLDIFMDSFLVLSPHFVQNLQKITNKDVIITEFGMSTRNSLAQSDFLIKGLTLFRNMGLQGCWIVYWNSEFDYYGIRDRPAEKAVGDWIAQNAS